MSHPTRHRRPRRDTAKTTNPGDAPVNTPAVALENEASRERLLYWVHDAAGKGRDVGQQATNAAAEAQRQDQAAAQCEQEEQKLLAQIKQVQLNRDTALHRAQEARAASARFLTEQKKLQGLEADARKLCALAGVDPDAPPEPGALPNGVEPARNTMPDDPLNGPLARFHEAHDAQDREDGPQADVA